jgi:hypothetical protein
VAAVLAATLAEDDPYSEQNISDAQMSRLVDAADKAERAWKASARLGRPPADLVEAFLQTEAEEVAVLRRLKDAWCIEEEWQGSTLRWGEGPRTIRRPPAKRAPATPKQATAPTRRPAGTSPLGASTGRLPDVPNPRAAAALVDVARASGGWKDWKSALDCAQRTGDRDSETMARAYLAALPTG